MLESELPFGFAPLMFSCHSPAIAASQEVGTVNAGAFRVVALCEAGILTSLVRCGLTGWYALVCLHPDLQRLRPMLPRWAPHSRSTHLPPALKTPRAAALLIPHCFSLGISGVAGSHVNRVNFTNMKEDKHCVGLIC